MTGWRETPGEAAQRVKGWKQGVGNWLQEYEWHHWLTLTVRGRWPQERVLRAFKDEFVRYATKSTQGPVRYAYVLEGGALGDRPHLHALLHGTERLGASRLGSAWRHGRSEVDPYDARRGATHYLAKEIGGRVLDYGVSERMPPNRIKPSHGRLNTEDVGSSE